MAPPSGRDDSIPLSRSEEGGSDVSLMASASDDRDRCDLSASSASSSPRPRRADGDSSSGGGKAGASAHQNLEALLPGMGGVSPKRRAPHKKEGVGACGNASGNAARKPPRGGGGADGGRCPFGLVGSIARTIVEEEEEDLAESEGAEGLSREEGRESGESCEDGGTRGNGGNGGPRDSSSSSIMMQLHTRQQTAQPGLQQDVKQQQQQQQQQEAQTVQAAQQDGEEWSISPPGSPQAATLSGVSAYFCGLPAGCILKRNSQPQQQRQRQQQRQACASCKKRVAESNPPRCLRCRQAVYCSSKCLSRHLNAHSRSCPGMRASRAAGSKRLGPGLGRVIVVDDDGNECAYKENNRIPVQPACSVSSAAESHLSWNCGYQNDGTSVEYSRCASATNAAATPAPATSYNATKKTAAAAAGRTGVTSPRSGMHSRITPHPSHPSTRTVTPSFAPVPSAAAASASTLSASTSGTASAATGVPGLCMGAA
ncbi:unnamed protein product [Closterium sp. NIES-64]|nr:unnamed protein product [Closterium sp. NIES-64]